MATVRVVNPIGSGTVQLAAHPLRRANPSVRYTSVAVDTDGDGQVDEAVIVRGGGKKAAIQAVARDVDADAYIDMERTRTFPTKHEALAQAHRVTPHVRELARRLSRGGD